MTLAEIVIVGLGAVMLGLIILLAIVFVQLHELGEQLDDMAALSGRVDALADLYVDQSTTAEIMLREHAELTRQVRALDSVVDGLVDLDQSGPAVATNYPAYTARERAQDREERAFDDPPNFPGEP